MGWLEASLTPGRYVGTEVEEYDEDQTFSEKISRLAKQLQRQQKYSQEIDKEIEKNLASLGYLTIENKPN